MILWLPCSVYFCQLQLPCDFANLLLSCLLLNYARYGPDSHTPSLPLSNYLLPLAGLHAQWSARLTMSSIATLTPAQSSAYPLSAPPSGVQSNFSTTAENNNKPMVVITSLVLALMLIFYSNRIYTKACIVRRFSWDDGKICAPKAAGATCLTMTVTITLAFVRFGSPSLLGTFSRSLDLS